MQEPLKIQLEQKDWQSWDLEYFERHLDTFLGQDLRPIPGSSLFEGEDQAFYVNEVPFYFLASLTKDESKIDHSSMTIKFTPTHREDKGEREKIMGANLVFLVQIPTSHSEAIRVSGIYWNESETKSGTLVVKRLLSLYAAIDELVCQKLVNLYQRPLLRTESSFNPVVVKHFVEQRGFTVTQEGSEDQHTETLFEKQYTL